MMDKETKNWLQTVFKKEELSKTEINSLAQELLQTHESLSVELYYELAKCNADAALHVLTMASQMKAQNEKQHLSERAAVAAGLLKKAYDLAFLYAGERSQGGKLIVDWSLVQKMLAEIYLKVELHEKLIRSDLSPAIALAILQECDGLVSQCMQVMGGAGYTEDYIVEKLFRQIHQLKNSPVPFAQAVMQFYKREVLHL